MKTVKIILISIVLAAFVASAGLVIYFSIDQKNLARAYAQASKAFTDGDYQKANQMLVDIIAQDNAHEEAYRLLAQTAQKMYNYPLEAYAWGQASRLNPLDKSLDNLRDEASLLAGRPVPVRDMLASPVRDGRATPEQQLLYARALIALGDDKGADKILKALALVDDPEYQLAQAQIAYAQGKFTDAEIIARKLEKANSATVRARADLLIGVTLATKGESETALKYMERAAADDPTLAARSLSVLYLSLGRLESAKTQLETISKFNTIPAVLADLAETYAGLGQIESLKKLAAGISPESRTLTELSYYIDAVLAFMEDDMAGAGKRLALCPAYRARSLYRLIALESALAGDDLRQIAPAANLLLGSGQNPQIRERVCRTLAAAFAKAAQKRDMAKAAAIGRVLLPLTDVAQPDLMLHAQRVVMAADLEADDTTSAIILSQAILKNDPADTQANFVMAQALARSGKAGESLPYFETLCAADPKQPEFWAGRANALDALGRTDEAVAAMRQMWQASPASVAGTAAYVNFLLAKNRFEQAETVADQCALSPTPAMAALGMFVKGRCLEAKGDKAGAIAQYEAADKKNPAWTMPTLALSHILEPDKAVALLEQAVKRMPNETDLRYRLGSLLAQEGQDQRAAEIYKALLETNPQWELLLVNYSEVLAKLGEHEKALELARTARRLAPRWDATAECLGMRLFEAKDYATAKGPLENVYASQPDNARVVAALEASLRELGRAAVAKGDRHAQRENFARLLQIKPGDAEADKALKALDEKPADK